MQLEKRGSQPQTPGFQHCNLDLLAEDPQREQDKFASRFIGLGKLLLDQFRLLAFDKVVNMHCPLLQNLAVAGHNAKMPRCLRPTEEH